MSALAAFEIQYDAVPAYGVPRIVLVDGSRESTEHMQHGLEDLGFEVHHVSSGRSVVTAIMSSPSDAIIVNASSFGINCFGLIATLRRVTDIPILIVSNTSEKGDGVRALSLGADDYLSQPFDWEEFSAHVHARLRRPRIERQDIVAFADLVVDAAQRRAARGGVPIELSAREFDLLLTFARNPERVFSRSQLLDLVWGVDRDVAAATVDTYVSYLRSKVDAGRAPLIHTVRGIGYTMRAQSRPY